MRSYYFLGVEFQFGKIKSFWEFSCDTVKDLVLSLQQLESLL